ncbi:Pentatricopeptide repeat-containing protein [Camellia lanceoleosa]|uniref:Pentatricopeptide repeat-containing protein n=1 Tax=Camellia lanceoleosa TaxID=1840588 RepID=A0ACC0I4J4_9ERIC|nr:Pentatricopeptide repeat-containing protein [Camellia lanceoleosa]
MLATSFLTVLKKLEPILYAPSYFHTNYHFLPFNYLLNSCSSLSDLKRIHALILTNGSHKNLLLSIKLITLARSVAPTMDYARKLFDLTPERDLFFWNTMIRGYADLGPCQEAIVLSRDMHRIGLLPDSYTFPSVVRSCAVLSAFMEGREVHCNIIKNGFDLDVFVQSSLIIISLFDRMPSSPVSWNAMILAYGQTNADWFAIKLFRRMLIEKVEFDYITMVSVISACANLEALNTGKWIHKLVRNKGLETNVSITNALIDMYAKCGNIDLATDAFNKLPHKSVVSWTSIIGACASHGHGDDALTLFTKMKEEGIRPNSFTFISVLTTCRHSV